MHVEMSSNSLINRLFNVKIKLNNMRCTLKKKLGRHGANCHCKDMGSWVRPKIKIGLFVVGRLTVQDWGRSNFFYCSCDKKKIPVLYLR